MLFFALASLTFSAGPAALQLRGRRVNAAMAKGNDAVDFPDLDGTDVRIGIVRARWHKETGDRLVEGVKKSLKECNVPEENIVEYEVPGSFELPLAARFMALSGKVDAIVPIGTLIKGDTLHFEVISESVTKALMDVGLSTGVPVMMGVLTCNTEAQVKERSSGKNNHGEQWGKAAVEMALLRASAIGRTGKKFFMGFGDDGSDAKAPSIGKSTPIGF